MVPFVLWKLILSWLRSEALPRLRWPCQLWQKDWGSIPKEILVVREPKTKQAAAAKPKATKAE